MNKKNYILNNAETKYFDYFFLKRLRYGKSIVVHIDKEGTDFSVTIPKDANFDAIKLKGDTVQDGTPTPDVPIDIEVVTGEQTIKINNKTYTINLGSIELCKIDTYQDYIYKSGDDWYVHKEIYNMELDKNTGFALYNGVSDVGFKFFRAEVPKSENKKLLCNYFNTSFEGWSNLTDQHIEMAQVYTNNALYLKVLESRASTLAELETWLTNNKTYAYYILNTSTNTKITDATLTTQLNALLASGLKAGSNTIKVTAPSGILPTIFNIIINH